MLTNELLDKDSIGRRMEHEEPVFVIEMAKKTKTTLTRVQCEKAKKENGWRTWAIKSQKEKKGRDKVKVQKDGKKKGEKGLRRG